MSAYEDRLRAIAEEEGMDWNTVRRVIASEGGFKDPFQRSLGSQGGVREYSLGPLQLNMRKGVGVEAKKAGFDASKDWEGAYRYGLNWAKKKGWGDWMGARKIGLAGGKPTGGGDSAVNQYALKKRHVGGAGSSPGYFKEDRVPVTTVAGDEPLTDPSLGGKEKPKSWGETLGGGLKEAGKAMTWDPVQISGQPPVDFSAGQAMPSVFRPQLMPSQVQAGVGGMGGGQDMRQLLALLMQGGLG